MKTVNVLGTEYRIRRVGLGDDEYMEKMNFGGYCDDVMKECVILNLESTDEWKHEPEERRRKHEMETIRHELVHAFLSESGLEWSSNDCDKPWAKNEEMVDWIALQGPKIYKAWQGAGAV